MNTSDYQKHYGVIAPLIMGHGVGDGRTTACLVAQCATIDALRKGLTLDKPTDDMECACPVLRRLAIRLNDGGWWKDDMERTNTLRPLIPMLLDSRRDEETTKKRVFFMCDRAVRHLTPMRLEWIAANAKSEKVKAHILEGMEQVKALAEITDKDSALAARKKCGALRASASAYAYAYASASADASAYAYADADAYAYADASASASAYAYAYASADADASAYAYADASAYASAYADAQKLKYRTALIEAFHACAAIE